MENEKYTTLDAYQAGYLILQGHNPNLINQSNGKVVFSFEVSDRLNDALRRYNTGDTVEALMFASTIKALKARIYSRKGNKFFDHGKPTT